MKMAKGRMDEKILVCVFYGPNGERLIKRGHKLASLLDCPLFVLTVDSLPQDEFDAEKSDFIKEWSHLSEQLDAEEFIVRDNEKRSSTKAIAEVVNTYDITQVIIGQSPQNRWEEITKGSFTNALLRELTFADIHIVAVDRTIKNREDAMYDKGVRCYLVQDKDSKDIRLSFHHPGDFLHEGIFYKETGTDFNKGIFKFIYQGKTYELSVTGDCIETPERLPKQL
ncbi:universal stress protein [Aciduricibacillus chroicocephali]|uniref:Universal stress protein n=1 Tax=Aciduricibacillus chroicocephali TaxID=3054939 RepID=A0ABY9KYK0_9BACI|nr:universal stress protein [Bacillaceae bacterium 44XB]